VAFEKPIQIQSFTCASDMSAASQQFIFVKLGATGVHPCTAATDVPVGVLQNLPERGQLAEVCMIGVSKVRAGGTDLALAAQIGIDSTSRAVVLAVGTTSTGSYILGRVLGIDNADNDGALVTAAVNCLAPARAV
jgi:hypothetical protein